MAERSAMLSKRLESLDILRGFDLFLLVFLQPVVVAVGRVADIPWLNAVLYQLDHEVWEGFRFWDLIMPLFLFMVGASMPFSFSKFRSNPDRMAVWRKVAKRFVILFVFGMVVQGNLLAFDLHRLYLYTNTLQAIAVGYLIAAVLMMNLSVKWQLVATVGLLVVYWIPMSLFGDYTPEGNFAEAVDRVVLGRWRDGVWWDDAGNWHFSEWYNYTWVWSSLTFGATVMSGVMAGEVIRANKENGVRGAKILAMCGVALVASGLLLSVEMPIIKRIWTSSMVLLSSGYCFLLMALFYWWIDCKGRGRGLGWLKIYGMNAITAYMLGEVVSFRSIVSSVSYGLQPWLGDYYPAWLTFGNFLILFFILRWMYRAKVFLKI